MENLKISMIEPVGGHGGMNYYDFNLCRELQTIEDSDVVLYTCDETISGLENFKIERSFKKIYGKSSKYIRGLNFIKGLVRSLYSTRKVNAKIVHYHFFHYTPVEYISMKFAKLIGAKVVVTAHDVESFSKGSSSGLAKKIYDLADHIIAHNHVSKNELIQAVDADEEKITIIPHGHYISSINFGINKQAALRQINVKDEKAFHILFFGQIKEVKGLDILIESLPEVIKVHKNIKVIIAGKVWKDTFEKYMTRIQELGIEEYFHFDIKYIPDDQVDYYFHAADLVVLPYKRIYQSGVLLNSMSYKKAVLASDLPGMTEIVSPGQNGFVFESENPASLADELISIIDNKDKIEEIGANAFEHVDKNHDWNAIAQKTVQVYKKLL